MAFRDLITLHTLHVEVAVEVGWPGAVQEMQPAVGNFLVRVHVAVVVLVAVDELKQTKQKKKTADAFETGWRACEEKLRIELRTPASDVPKITTTPKMVQSCRQMPQDGGRALLFH